MGVVAVDFSYLPSGPDLDTSDLHPYNTALPPFSATLTHLRIRNVHIHDALQLKSGDYGPDETPQLLNRTRLQPRAQTASNV